MQYLKSIGDFADLNIDQFVNDGPIRKAFEEAGLTYDTALANNANPSALPGDPALAGDVWFDGDKQAQPVADPTALLRAVKQAQAQGKKVRAAYVPDAELGTRWFADKAIWVRDGDNYLPFTTTAAADRYRSQHPTAAVVSYEQAVTEVRQ